MLNTVSVIIPTYNRATVLPRAIQSVLDQDSPAHEIIVVDDGSTDNTAELIKNQFPMVRYLKQQNLGVSTARNRGIHASTGHWIALLDSDDQWLAPKLARQLAALAAQPTLRICHTEERWIRNGKRVNPMHKHRKQGGWIFPQCLPLCAISPSSVVIERALLLEAGLFDESLPACEDYDLWLRLCAHHPVLFIDTPLLVKYGGHDDQLSKQFPAMDRFRIQALLNILQDQALRPTDRQASLAMLEKKISIYVNGARKRGKLEQAQEYAQLLARVMSTSK